MEKRGPFLRRLPLEVLRCIFEELCLGVVSNDETKKAGIGGLLRLRLVSSKCTEE